MKNTIRTSTIVILLCGTLLCLALILFTAPITNTYNLYAMSSQVVELDQTNNIVTIKDKQGFLWSFVSCDDWQLNDCCVCIMDNKGTHQIFDDEIISVKYEKSA